MFYEYPSQAILFTVENVIENEAADGNAICKNIVVEANVK